MAMGTSRQRLWLLLPFYQVERPFLFIFNSTVILSEANILYKCSLFIKYNYKGSHRKFGKICQKLSSSINERAKKRESRSKFSSSSDALISSASSECTTYEKNSISSNRKTSSIKDTDEESQKESFTPRISDPQDNENNLFINGDFSSSSDLLDSSNSSIEIEEGKMYETDDSITDQQIAENSLKTTIL